LSLADIMTWLPSPGRLNASFPLPLGVLTSGSVPPDTERLLVGGHL
jgi:hypothetical protein